MFKVIAVYREAKFEHNFKNAGDLVSVHFAEEIITKA